MMIHANAARSASRPPLRVGRAFTLLELVVAMLAASMLLVGLSSALYLTLQATEPDLGGHDSALRGGEALVDLASELRFAEVFLERGVNAVEFTVADRDSDTSSETIRWEWTGVAGDPLTRQYNGGTAVSFLENVHDFSLAYNIDSVTTTQQGTGPVTSDEFMLANFEGWEGVSHDTLTYDLGPTSRAAEYFVAQGIPVDVESIEITRISLRLRKNAGGNLEVSVHQPQSGSVEPEIAQIGTGAIVNVSTLPPSFQWVDIDFSDVTLNSYQDEFVVVVAGTIASAATVEHYYSGAAPADSTVMLYGNTIWSPPSFLRNRYDIPFRAYGRYTELSESEVPVTRYFVVGGDATVQVGADSTRSRRTSVNILNRVEASQP